MATPGKLTLNTGEFSKWAAAEIQFSRKDAAEVLNKAAGDVALRAIPNTVRASYSRMVKKFKKAGSQRGITLKSGRQSRGKAARYQTFDPTGYVYAVLNYYIKHGKMPAYQIGIMPKKLMGIKKATKAAAIQFVNAKLRSIAYIATGFAMAAKFFGKPVTIKLSPKGYVYHSTGEKATPWKLMAKIHNYARDAGDAARKPADVDNALQKALDSVTDDIRGHLTKKMQARAKKAGAVP